MSVIKGVLIATALTIAAASPALAQEKIKLRVMNGDGILIDEDGYIYTGKITDKGKAMAQGGKKTGFVVLMQDGKMIMVPVTSREAREVLTY